MAFGHRDFINNHGENMDLSTLIKGSKNSLSKKAAICMTALALTAPLFMQHVYAGPVNVNTASQSELDNIHMSIIVASSLPPPPLLRLR